VQWIGHALILLLLSRGLISLRGLRLGEAFAKAVVASAAMGATAWGLVAALRAIGVERPLVQLGLAGAGGALLYFGLCALMRVEALDFFIAVVVRRLRRRAERPVTSDE